MFKRTLFRVIASGVAASVLGAAVMTTGGGQALAAPAQMAKAAISYSHDGDHSPIVQVRDGRRDGRDWRGDRGRDWRGDRGRDYDRGRGYRHDRHDRHDHDDRNTGLAIAGLVIGGVILGALLSEAANDDHYDHYDHYRY